MTATQTATVRELLATEWAEREDLQFAALVFCLEQTQPLVPITRFN